MSKLKEKFYKILVRDHRNRLVPPFANKNMVYQQYTSTPIKNVVACKSGYHVCTSEYIVYWIRQYIGKDVNLEIYEVDVSGSTKHIKCREKWVFDTIRLGRRCGCIRIKDLIKIADRLGILRNYLRNGLISRVGGSLISVLLNPQQGAKVDKYLYNLALGKPTDL